MTNWKSTDQVGRPGAAYSLALPAVVALALLCIYLPAKLAHAAEREVQSSTIKELKIFTAEHSFGPMIAVYPSVVPDNNPECGNTSFMLDMTGGKNPHAAAALQGAYLSNRPVTLFIETGLKLKGRCVITIVIQRRAG